jgi:hypothetical protein
MSKKPNFEQIAKEITTPSRKNYDTRKVISNFPNEIWSCDLCQLDKLADDNDKYKFLLCIIDVFTRYAYVIPLKTKSDKDVLDGFKKAVIENNKEYPKLIWTDSGSEFKNKLINNWYSDHDITRYSTYGSSKSAIVERFNRTLKNIMWKHLLSKRTYRYIDELEDMVDFYNNKIHRTIKMTPAKAKSLNEEGINKLWLHQYSDIKPNKHDPAFHVGDIVRLNLSKDTFKKSYEGNWSRNLYKITKQLNTIPWTYNNETLDGEQIEGSFYELELLKSQSTENENYLVGKKYEVISHSGNGTNFLLKVKHDNNITYEPIETFIEDGGVDPIAYQYIMKKKISKQAGI